MKYEYTYVRTDNVAENIDEFVIPECQEACKAFWSKNIMTYMCSNYNEDGDKKYVLLTSLSPENDEIMQKLVNDDPEHYYYSGFRDKYGIRVEGNDIKKVSEQLVVLTEPFIIQDIYEGTMTREAFLIRVVGLGIPSENPEFNKFIQSNPEPEIEDFDDPSEFINASEKYNAQIPAVMIYNLDESRITKTFEEYLEETGYTDLYDSDLDVVFVSQFYKDAHLRFLKHQKENNRPKETGLPLERIEEGENAINPNDLNMISERLNPEPFEE